MANFNDFDPRQEANDSCPSTLHELVADQMRFEGAQVPEQAWILSDFDTWERNPHYHGPAARHPEDTISDEAWDALTEQERAAYLGGRACEHGRSLDVQCVPCLRADAAASDRRDRQADVALGGDDILF